MISIFAKPKQPRQIFAAIVAYVNILPVPPPASDRESAAVSASRLALACTESAERWSLKLAIPTGFKVNPASCAGVGLNRLSADGARSRGASTR